MPEARRESSAVGWGLRWLRERSPLVTRRAHEAELRALERATGELLASVRTLGAATQRATGALSESARRWQAAAMRLAAERDDARREADRLRATVASLMLASVKRGMEG